MPATLIPSAGCCTVDDLSVTSAVPGPQGPAGADGADGADGENAYTTTAAQFTVPAVGANVTVTLTDASFVPQISNGAELYLSIGNAGYFLIVSKSGNDVVVTNPTLASANAAPTTVIAVGAIVTVSGPPGQDGADGASGAPDTATYIIQTANGSLGSAQVLGSLASGYVKVTTTTGVLSSVTAITASTDLTGAVPVANGGTNLTSYTIGDLIYASGATTLSKLAGVATGNAVISGGVATAPSWGKIGLTTHVSGTLPAANGGTGIASYTIGDLVYASGATAISALAGVATGNALISGGVATAPSWGKVGLTTHVSGTLPVANGGRGLTAFNYVYAYSAGTQNIATVTSATVIYGTESFDTGNTFNNGTGVWTPGIVGKVFIVANILGSWGSSGTNRVKLSIKRNGTIVYTKVCDWVNHNVDTSHTISGVFDSAANTDTFEVDVENLNAHTFTLNTTAQGTSFFGYVIGA